MDIHFKKLLLPILALFAMTAHAQSLSGLVTDEETGQPLEAVMISVLRNGTMIDYALTDAREIFPAMEIQRQPASQRITAGL